MTRRVSAAYERFRKTSIGCMLKHDHLPPVMMQLLRENAVLMDMFFHDYDDEQIAEINNSGNGSLEEACSSARKLTEGNSYESIAKSLIQDEKQYLKDLNLLVHVFRRAFEDAQPKSKDVEVVFSQILDIHELTVRFLRLLEDLVEMSDSTCVGAAFYEMAEGAEFDVYYSYSLDVSKSQCFETLNSLLKDSSVRKHFEDRGSGFFLAAKYVLPKLLLVPVRHCFEYFRYLDLLTSLQSDPYDDDTVDLVNTAGLLSSLKTKLESSWGSRIKTISEDLKFMIPSEHGARQTAVILRIQRSIDGWEGKDIGYNCTELLMEGTLGKVRYNAPLLSLGPADTLRSRSATKFTERYVFLFDNLIVTCKTQTAQKGAAYKFKEKMAVRKVDIVDREDTEDLSNAWEIWSRDKADVKNSNPQHPFILFAKSSDEKEQWLAAMVYRQTRSMLDRMLDVFLKEEEKRIPLILPTPEQYRFSEADSDENIIFEDYTSSSGIPVVRGGSLDKLVERLTYPQYADSQFLRTFLMTYRAFCSPSELLNLLIERFEIPLPSGLTDLPSFYSIHGVPSHHRNGPELSVVALEPRSPYSETVFDQSIARFRKEYQQPVQLRVLSALRHWVTNHWYDFEEDPAMLDKLEKLLRESTGNFMKRHVKSVMTIVDRNKKGTVKKRSDLQQEFVGRRFPEIVWHIVQPSTQLERYTILTLHPLEFARQLTLCEFDLYKAVKPSELVGAGWTKKDKHKRSPQLLKLTRHTTNITYWLEKCIVEAGNIEERSAILNRVVEIMCVFEELNNFNSLLAFFSALSSTSVYRLKWTWEKLDPKLGKAYERFERLLQDPHKKAYKDKLKNINPPCVPFFGTYLSWIFFLEEGNPAYLNMGMDVTGMDVTGDDTNSVSINQMSIISFHKCRKIANVIQEIQMYQNEPYALARERNIQHFFESLNPLGEFGDKESLETYLYNRSQEIEPKECDKPPFFPPALNYSLKSPGIKPPSSKPHPHSQKMRVKGLTAMDGGFMRGHSNRVEQAFEDNVWREKRLAHDDANSDFAVVDIRPGDPRGPRHVVDLPDHRMGPRYFNPSSGGARRKSSQSPPQVSSPPIGHRSNRSGTNSSRFSPPIRGSATPTPSSSGLLGPDSPPPLPPRSSTLGRPSPTPGPKPFRAGHPFNGSHHQHHHHHEQRKASSGSPHSPLSPGLPPNGESPPTFNEASLSGRHGFWSPASSSPQSGGGHANFSAGSGNGQSSSGKSFVFPPAPGAAPAFFGVHSSSATLPAGIGGHSSRPSSLNSTNNHHPEQGSSSSTVPLEHSNSGSPPNVPPRHAGGRHRAALPPPLSPTLVQQEIALVSTSSSKPSTPPKATEGRLLSEESSPTSARRSSSCMSEGSTGPPLPPRGTPRSTSSLSSPPPRPPKKNQAAKTLESASAPSELGAPESPAPPLPPKTYKHKKGS